MTFVCVALAVGRGLIATESCAHHNETLGLRISRVRRTWLVVLACGVALAVGQPASAASGDAVARQVVPRHDAAVRTQFSSVQICLNVNSAPCLQTAASGLYAAAVRARATVAALLARPLSPRVRSGVSLDIRALSLQAQYALELNSATQSHDVARIRRLLANMRYALTLAGRAMVLIYT